MISSTLRQVANLLTNEASQKSWCSWNDCLQEE